MWSCAKVTKERMGTVLQDQVSPPECLRSNSKVDLKPSPWIFPGPPVTLSQSRQHNFKILRPKTRQQSEYFAICTIDSNFPTQPHSFNLHSEFRVYFLNTDQLCLQLCSYCKITAINVSILNFTFTE